MAMRKLSWAVILLLLTSCQVFGGGGGGTGEEVVEEQSSAPIEWDRSPATVVFRVDVVGGEYENAFFSRNEVPFCSIYGDNRIVWTVPSSASDALVLYDRLTDAQISEFVGMLTVEKRIFTYSAQADRQLPSQVSPAVETIWLAVNGLEHKTDAFGDWPDDFFTDIVNACRSLSQSPVEFVPEGAWLSAQAAPVAPGVPSIIWDSAAANLSLKALADKGEREWVTGRNVGLLWNALRTTSLDAHFSDTEGNFQVAVEVPGVNPSAPPAPSS